MRNPLPSLLALACTLALAAGSAQAQQLGFHFYGNTQYAVENTTSTANRFELPRVELVVNGSIDRFQLTSEILFDLGKSGEFGLDVHRVELSYLVTDALRLSMGRFPTGLGFYNTNFPQGGAYYELAIDRPTLVSTVDEETLLPTLTLGARADGRIKLGAAGRLQYDLEVGNGRGPTTFISALAPDNKSLKAFNVRLRYLPRLLDGLVIGGNFYLDEIPASAEKPRTLREVIVGGHLAYVESPWHFIAEAYDLRHSDRATGEVWHTLAGLAEVGFTLGEVTPYARLEVAVFPDGLDPFWATGAQQSRGDYQAVSVGARWVINASFAAKLELERNHSSRDTSLSSTLQLAFAF